MTKGGFLAEMLASKHAAGSDTKFLWRYLYYIYIGLPLLVSYYFIYVYVIGLITETAYSLLGIGRLSRYSLLHLGLTIALSLGVAVALFHFHLLPVLFAPVKLITSV